MVELEKTKEIFIPFGDTRTPEASGLQARKLSQKLGLNEGYILSSATLRPQNIALIAKLPESQRAGYLPGYHVRVYTKKEKQ